MKNYKEHIVPSFTQIELPNIETLMDNMFFIAGKYDLGYAVTKAILGHFSQAAMERKFGIVKSLDNIRLTKGQDTFSFIGAIDKNYNIKLNMKREE